MLKKEPKQARSRAMIDHILAGAARVLEQRPLSEATTNQIAQVAGVSVGSLYQYFDSKDEIGFRLLLRHIDEAADLVREMRIATRGQGDNRLTMIFAAALREHRATQALHRNLLPDGRPASHELQAGIRRIVEQLELTIAEECPGASPQQIALCAALFHQTATRVIHAALSDGDPADDEALVARFGDLAAAHLRFIGAR